MKMFDIKIARRTFFALLALQVVLFIVVTGDGRTPLDYLWLVVNWPGYLLGGGVGDWLGQHGVHVTRNSLFAGIGLFCTLLWASVFGFLVRRKVVANIDQAKREEI